MNIIRRNHLRSSASPLLCVTVVIFLTLTTGLTRAASFEVSGYIEFRSYKQETLSVTGVRDFQVSVRDNAYCIRLNPAQGDKEFQYLENASDGTNGYSFVRFQHNGKSTSINDSTLVISSEREPSNFDGAQLGSIWLAYCANSLFTNGRPTF